MSSVSVREQSVEQQLAGLSTRLLFGDLGAATKCFSEEQLIGLARQTVRLLDDDSRQHLSSCARCAHRYGTMRAHEALHNGPLEWSIPIKAPRPVLIGEDGPWQVLGHIDLDSRRFFLCRDHDEWIESPLCMRVNLVLDTASDLFAVTILDVPREVIAMNIELGNRRLAAHPVDESSCYELMKAATELAAIPNEDDAVDSIARCITEGGLQLVMIRQATDLRDDDFKDLVHSLLYDLGAIETEYEYELPAGLHCDTFINVGKLCASEEALDYLGAGFHCLFRDVKFDTIVANGWATAMVGRRITSHRSGGNSQTGIREIVCEGYQHPTFTGDVLPGSEALILVDVCFTGVQINQLVSAVRRSGGRIAGIGAVVLAKSDFGEAPPGVRHLSCIEMRVFSPARHLRHPREQKELRVFNPVSQSMTMRSPYPRSPSEFLDQDEAARELWSFVDMAGAYEHHHWDRDEDAHYLAFVDTQKMLKHADVGHTLVSRLCDRITQRFGIPDVLIVPDRPRSRILGVMLRDVIRKQGSDADLHLIHVRRSRRFGPARERRWCEFTSSQRDLIKDAYALVLDTGAGHGATIDRLTQMSKAANARAVGAAVLLSRLTETCEQAFDARLSAGFCWLYHLPIRPVVIRGSDSSLCPVCRRRAALQSIGKSTRSEAVRKWCEYVLLPVRRSPGESTGNPLVQKQLSLFPPREEFIHTCRRAVASGITLHSVNAAMNNGMAPLRLPELGNAAIPVLTRAAIVDNLPKAALEWSGEVLLDDLRAVLSSEMQPSLWRASADALVRAGSHEWIEQFPAFLNRLGDGGRSPPSTFWSQLACLGYVTAACDPGLSQTLRECINQLLATQEYARHSNGLQLLLEAVEP